MHIYSLGPLCAYSSLVPSLTTFLPTFHWLRWMSTVHLTSATFLDLAPPLRAACLVTRTCCCVTPPRDLKSQLRNYALLLPMQQLGIARSTSMFHACAIRFYFASTPTVCSLPWTRILVVSSLKPSAGCPCCPKCSSVSLYTQAAPEGTYPGGEADQNILVIIRSYHTTCRVLLNPTIMVQV